MKKNIFYLLIIGIASCFSAYSFGLNKAQYTPYLAITGNNGTILTSDNGSTWVKRESNTTQDLSAIRPGFNSF